MQPDTAQITSLYCGFHIEKAVGNNAFSYAQRQQKSIYVAPLLCGQVEKLAVGTDIVFSEIEDNVENNCLGLQRFHLLQTPEKTIFIFDNHNHAFTFWVWAAKNSLFPIGGLLMHIDQHKDMRVPLEYLESKIVTDLDLEEVLRYTNFSLNVGNFIQPALQLGLFSEVKMLVDSCDFKKELPDQFVLDVDIDIFANEMKYIDHDFKIQHIRSCMKLADFITIATSPFFMDQTEAIEIVKEILEPFI